MFCFVDKMIKFFGVYKVLRWLNNHRHSMTNNKVQPDNNNNNDDNNNIEENNGNSSSSTTTKNINVQSATPNKEDDNTQPFNDRGEEIRRTKSTKSQQQSLRLEKVISGVQGIEGKMIDEIKHDIVIQCKSLMKFLGAFILYACAGGLLFFYIEECSGWSNAGDSSIPQIGDRYIAPTYKNLTWTCFELYKNATKVTSVDIMPGGHFDIFLSVCQTLVKEGVNPFVKEGHKRKCVWDEFQLLKYAEYTIFTLLTIGK